MHGANTISLMARIKEILFTGAVALPFPEKQSIYNSQYNNNSQYTDHVRLYVCWFLKVEI